MQSNITKINTIIIEDNIDSQKYLESILKNNFREISISGYASTIRDSITLIENSKPELVFMDIELEDGMCFDILIRRMGLKNTVTSHKNIGLFA